MLRLAYLVLCHKNASQINRMIDALRFNYSEAVTDFYIHIDKKSNIAPEIKEANDIFFVDDFKRVDVNWGQISSVDAILVLLKMVKDSKKEYDYIWLISGQDYPIKSERESIDIFEMHRGINFINSVDIKSKIYKRYLKRNIIEYPGWIENPNIFIKILRKLYILITGGHYNTFYLFKKKRLLGNIKYYFGSAWFCITYQCGKYILDYLDRNLNYYNFFKNAEIPDECFFHTIIFNSPFRSKIIDSLCYVDWSEGKRNPRILTSKDYKDLIVSKYLIARKFDSSIESNVLDMIDLHNNRILSKDK